MGGVYALNAVFSTSCGGDEFGPIGYVSGGQPESLTTAVALAAFLLLAGGVTVWGFPRWRRRTFGVSTALYAGSLGLLWAISPAVWGAGVCAGTAQPHVAGQVGRLLQGHTDAVQSVAFSPNGHLLASSSDDGTIRLWGVRRQRELGRSLWRANGSINDVAFSPNGRQIAAGACDGTVRLWDVRTRAQLGKPILADHDRACVNGVAFSPNGRSLVSASELGRVRLWDVRTHKQLGLPLGHPGNGFNDVAFSPDGRTVVAAVRDVGFGAVVLWDLRSHHQLGQPGRVGLPVQTVAFSPGGRVIVSGDVGGAVRLWNVRGDRRRGTLYQDRDEDAVDSIDFSADGHTLAASFDLGALRIWDVQSKRELVDERSVEARSVAFSPAGHMLAVGNADGTIRLLHSPRQ